MVFVVIMSIIKTLYDTMPDGREVYLYTIENNNGIKAVPRTIKYVLRETPHNLCKGKILKYREYFIADEDGMLQKHAERLVGVEK